MATRKALVHIGGIARELPAGDTLDGAGSGGSGYDGGGIVPRPGQWFHTPITGGLSNQGYPGLYASPLPIGKAVSLTAFQFKVSTAPSASTIITVGLYADNGSGSPGALIVDGGGVAITATGVYTVTLPNALALTAGLYWVVLGMPSQYNGIAVVAASGYGYLLQNYYMGWSDTWGANGTVGLWNTSYSGGALPATYGTTYNYQGPGGGSAPLVLVKFG